MSKNKDYIEYNSSLINKLFFNLMPAAILTMVTPSINSIVDGIFASNFIGKDAMSAIGIYSPFINVLIGISTVFLGGSLIITGAQLGRGNQKKANAVFSTDIFATVLILTVISIFMTLFSRTGALLLGAKSDTLMTEAASYIRGVSFSAPFIYLAGHLSSYLELEQQHKRNIIGIILMVISNTVFDFLFVYVFKMGCLGLGLATTLSSITYAVVLVTYYFSGKSLFRLSLSDIELALLPEVIKIGFPGAIGQVYLAIRGYYVNQNILLYEGEEGMAAFSAVATFGTIFFAATYGISVSARTLFSIFIGSKDRKSLQTTLKIAICKAFPVNMILSVLFAILAPLFSFLYFHNTASHSYELSIFLFRIYPIAMCISTIGCVFSALYQCLGRMKIVNFISLMDGLVGMVLAIVVLCPFIKIYGVWVAFIINGILVTIIVLVYTMAKTKRFPQKIDDWLLLPDDFGVGEDNRMNYSVHNEEDVVCCSERIITYLKERGFDSKKSYYAGLALEEMAANIIDHGYRKDKAHHNAVIELAVMGEELLITMMDDCVEFDPIKRAAQDYSDDPARNIGIRTVQKIAKEMKYHRMVGINVLSIRL